MAKPLSYFQSVNVEELRGVGEKKKAALKKLGVNNIFDVLTYYPRRYIDRTNQASIADLHVGEEATILVEVEKVSSRRTRNGRVMVNATVTDGSGRLAVTFFNQPFRERQLATGNDVVLFGKLEVFNGRRTMTNPIVDLVGNKTARIVPVYPQSEKSGLMTWDLSRICEEAVRRAREIEDPVDEKFLDEFDLIDRTAAFHGIHLPETMEEVAAARKRLVFDELLRVQLELVRRKREIESSQLGIAHQLTGDLVSAFHSSLPYALTGAQARVIEEIFTDLQKPAPMHRLLQGDVGAGKTVVAVSAMLAAVESGHQGAMMAPTEVLAEQHFASIRALCAAMTISDSSNSTLFDERHLRIELLTSRTTAAQRRKILSDLEAGSIDIIIGTHALLQSDIQFRSLGVVVIDEQHRFGVEQRDALRQKGTDRTPDVLVMTATPIPRTAAMTVYGDLDVSVLDEMPPGRTPIHTVWAQSPLEETQMWTKVREQVAAGFQAYVVCPLIDESEKLEVRSAQETFDELQNGELREMRLALLHGRMSSDEKDDVMAKFRNGSIDVVIATTVIEVGVDVPNATVIVILDAARFGMAQLHQLRGRVGRGIAESFCYLAGEASTDEGKTRLGAIVQSTDGFALAEIDLDIRGEGTIMGQRQKGQNDLKLASLRRDREWVEKARAAAIAILDADPQLDRHESLRDEIDEAFSESDVDNLLKG
ncbi:MAG: ATP-dependent helicase RecG [Actinomycetota bacterium]|jgi:ATP-dependent DNA helicase RecG